ncbi:MAG: CPBP family intramembrane glutamic endopeptidase [Propionicimonas sp.]
MVSEPGLNPAFWPPVPVRASALPVVPRAYHEFFRAPRNRWWKPLLGLAMFVGTWLLGIIVVTLAAVFYDLSTGRSVLDDFRTGSVKITPMLFTANNLGLALAIPLAGLSAWAVFGQRPRWISSIHGGFRWGLFWRFGAVALAVGLLGLVIGLATEGVDGLRWNADSAFLIVAVLVTTPFQAAGEEYGVRGFLARSIGSWFSSRRAGFVVATVITSAVFMALHAAENLWLNLYYFGVGVICSILVRLTGGLEAAVALHVVNNLVGEATLPFTSLQGLFDRGPSSAGPEALIQLVFTVAVMAGMLWVARRLRLETTFAPAARPPGVQ